ncbi:protein ENHANCED DOWNY MILDEW 2-like isoform X2 [Mercurialis annua]|uniref:protein ENHANCED DOWNY MILDEW 2-like isoform X2 n=1 Tax=Mercurialis annua TaxID=3986 RepID=UPI0024ADD9DE|nr:protein ENHANCED DOWNY MILDEW 2-like isoform X2 [Mercurialis annua]
MALSDEEEGEILSNYVMDYYFVDESDTLVSFSNLPVQWDDNVVLPDSGNSLVLRGTCDDGFQSVYLPIIAWKFELSYIHPEISVLSKRKKWTMLQKPRKVFEPIIRKILVTVHWLHFCKKYSDASQAFAWKHLQKNCSSYCGQLSVNDLLEHKLLIVEAASRDKDIEESKNAGASKDFDKDGNEEQIFDKVCAICDDGGNLLCCNGRCLRSFHPTVADGLESKCASLGFRNEAEYEAIPVYQCENCIYQQHQCFACGRLGSSARSSCQEVFPCASATCGHFYHPECVARLLHADNESQAEELRDRITAGESFACPAHKCFSCKQHEVSNVKELQFAICRRCPKAYHRKCLPRDFILYCQSDENNLQRAWEGLLPNKRILIYCMEHKIFAHLRTALRNHLIFPGVERTHAPELMAGLQNSVMSKKTKDFSIFKDRPANKKLKHIDSLYTDVGILDSSAKKERCHLEDLKPLKKLNPAKKPSTKFDSISARSSTVDNTNFLYENNLSMNLGSIPSKSKQHNIPSSKIKSTLSDKPAMQKAKITRPVLDAEMEKGILTLMEDVSSSFDVEEFKERNARDTNSHPKNKLENSIPLGMVEVSVKAVQTALQMLDKGCTIEDAKTVCSPEVLREIFRWKAKLNIYLTPIFHGARYTSFGRHFTQVGKLKEIVDRIQWYVQDGDMIVDFCCGSNDFSCLLNERLEKNGKPCFFKNYDIIQAKNDFCFEKRDWLTVDQNELPDGSRLIMGLNPPFGVNASLANTFINKALEFSPKLIVLIVPQGTQRLDEKAPYDLIWEDQKLLSGKSFYLPGSVDVNDKQMDQWNNIPPPLYLWSRLDWTPEHASIARQCGHVSN